LWLLGLLLSPLVRDDPRKHSYAERHERERGGLWLVLGQDPAYRKTILEIAWIGVPVTPVGLVCGVLAGSRLLPGCRPATTISANAREYTVEMLVARKSPLVGQTIEDEGLRHLLGVYPMRRDGDAGVLGAVSSSELLHARTRAAFRMVVGPSWIPRRFVA